MPRSTHAAIRTIGHWVIRDGGVGGIAAGSGARVGLDVAAHGDLLGRAEYWGSVGGARCEGSVHVDRTAVETRLVVPRCPQREQLPVRTCGETRQECLIATV